MDTKKSTIKKKREKPSKENRWWWEEKSSTGLTEKSFISARTWKTLKEWQKKHKFISDASYLKRRTYLVVWYWRRKTWGDRFWWRCNWKQWQKILNNYLLGNCNEGNLESLLETENMEWLMEHIKSQSYSSRSAKLSHSKIKKWKCYFPKKKILSFDSIWMKERFSCWWICSQQVEKIFLWTLHNN